MADLFEGYELGSGWDETFGEPGLPRRTYDAILTALRPLGTEELGPRVDALARAFMDSGVTFAYDGQERPFPV
ncbi:MAG TPA: circularly permuted type 2 ATP-grasp protein, partial [Kribbellaceae bacterium]|nr:circularly permuted type 2 ATP-grasp protein [Kribbellaceae bacterium]